MNIELTTEELILQDKINHINSINKAREDLRKQMDLLNDIANITTEFKLIHKDIFKTNS